MRVLLEVLQGLAYLHTVANIAHRDIKTANVLLDGRLGARIGDFGLVKHIRSTEGKTTTMLCTEHVIGTAIYMAPEVHQGQSSLAQDIYALGVVVLETLTGLPAANPTKTHCSITLLADEYWDEDEGLRPLLDTNVLWASHTVAELAGMAEVVPA